MTISELRGSLHKIWEAALNAGSPAKCIPHFVQINDGVLSLGGKEFPFRGRVIVIGAGKASAKMAQVVEDIIGDRITGGLVVTKYGHALPLRRIRLVEAGHPIPDAAGMEAARQTRELLKGLTPDDLVLCLISGGGSAFNGSPPR